jgi:bifunctional polynucleotide phosphatase/kinase
MDWKETDESTYLHGVYKHLELKDNDKIAAFDLDHTLVIPADNKKFSSTDKDWIFIDPSIPGKLEKLHKKGYKLVIISNQKGISQGKVNEGIFKKKIEAVASSLNIPLVFLASKYDDGFRKPRTGLWTQVISKINIDKKSSFFCGDAGGLPKRKINGSNVKKDFSDSDLKFARNLNLKFVHRDQFVYNVDSPDLKQTYGVDFGKIPIKQYDDFVPLKEELELVIMVGYPGSGKSYYATKYILPHGYKYINRDTLGTLAKCVKMVKQHLQNNESVVVDNTNPSEKARKQFIDIAKLYGCKVRCINFTTSMDLSMHNNIYRGITKNMPIVPKIAYNIYKKNFQTPTKSEGLYKIENIDFNLDSSMNLDKYMEYLF